METRLETFVDKACTLVQAQAEQALNTQLARQQLACAQECEGRLEASFRSHTAESQHRMEARVSAFQGTLADQISRATSVSDRADFMEHHVKSLSEQVTELDKAFGELRHSAAQSSADQAKQADAYSKSADAARGQHALFERQLQQLHHQQHQLLTQQNSLHQQLGQQGQAVQLLKQQQEQMLLQQTAMQKSLADTKARSPTASDVPSVQPQLMQHLVNGLEAFEKRIGALEGFERHLSLVHSVDSRVRDLEAYHHSTVASQVNATVAAAGTSPGYKPADDVAEGLQVCVGELEAAKNILADLSQSMLTAASPPINHVPPSPAVSSLSSPVTPLSLPDEGYDSRSGLPLHRFASYPPQAHGLRL
eukprot:gene2468-516_t